MSKFEDTLATSSISSSASISSSRCLASRPSTFTVLLGSMAISAPWTGIFPALRRSLIWCRWITGPASHLHQISERLKAGKIPVQGAEIAMLPKSTVKVDGRDARHLLELIEALEEMDDVARVSSNFDIDAEALAAATA